MKSELMVFLGTSYLELRYANRSCACASSFTGSVLLAVAPFVLAFPGRGVEVVEAPAVLAWVLD